MRKKVSIVGAGNVGATAAHWIASKELADVVLIDIMEGVPQGKALDLLQAMPVEKRDSAILGTNDYADTANSDIVVITAGIPRKPGMSRDDLLNTNYKIMQDVVGKVVKYSPNCILIVVSNPLDAMAQAAFKLSGFSRNRVIGMAGVLDSAPFPHLHRAGTECQRGERHRVRAGRPRRHHGSAAALLDGCRNSDHRIDRPGNLERLVQRTRDGGAEIVKHLKTGSAYYAPSAAAVGDGGSHPEGQEEDSALRRVPGRRVRNQRAVRRRAVKLGANGIEQIIEIKLTAEEQAALKKSAAAVKELIAVIGL